MTSRMHRYLRAFGREEKGTAAVEFALLFPWVFFMFIWAVELGLLMTKSVMLEHAVDVAMRDIRLGNMANPTSDSLKDSICDRARIISGCRATIMLDLQPVSGSTWVLPPRTAACRDRSLPIQPVVSWTLGQTNDLMIVRACVLVSPLFPGTDIGRMLVKDANGELGMTAITSYVTEPLT